MNKQLPDKLIRSRSQLWKALKVLEQYAPIELSLKIEKRGGDFKVKVGRKAYIQKAPDGLWTLHVGRESFPLKTERELQLTLFAQLVSGDYSQGRFGKGTLKNESLVARIDLLLEYADSTTEAELRSLARELYDQMKKAGMVRRQGYVLDQRRGGWVFGVGRPGTEKPMKAHEMKRWLLNRIEGVKRAARNKRSRDSARIRRFESLFWTNELLTEARERYRAVIRYKTGRKVDTFQLYVRAGSVDDALGKAKEMFPGNPVEISSVTVTDSYGTEHYFRE